MNLCKRSLTQRQSSNKHIYRLSAMLSLGEKYLHFKHCDWLPAESNPVARHHKMTFFTLPSQ